MNPTLGRYLKSLLLLTFFFLAGWTFLVDNFLGKALDQATFNAPANLTIPQYISATGKWTAQTITITAADIDELIRLEELSDVATMTEATGDIIFRTAGGAWDRLAIGTAGQKLEVSAGLPAWVTAAAATIILQESDATVDAAAGTVDFAGYHFDISSSPAGEANVFLATDGVTESAIAADAVGASEIVGGAPGAAGAELADSVTNITANTTLTLVGNGAGFGVTVGTEAFSFANLDGAGGTDAIGDIAVRDAVTGVPAYRRLGVGAADTFLASTGTLPAYRLLLAADIDELIRLEELSDVATMTEAAGDIITRNAGNTAWDKLAVGAENQILQVNSGAPAWTTATTVNSAVTAQEGDVTVALTAATLDFHGDHFDVTESPLTEANVFLATDGVTSSSIAAAAVGTSEVEDNSLTATDLGADSVDTSEIVGGAPGAAGVEFADSVTNITANTTLTLVGAGTGGVTIGEEAFSFANLSGAGGADAVGDIAFRATVAGAPVYTRLAIGTTGQFLTVVGGVPAWTTAAASTIIVQEEDANVDTATGTIDFLGADFDVASSPAGEANVSIAADAITYAKIQNTAAASVIIGRGSAAGAGDVQELTAGNGLAIVTTTVVPRVGPGAHQFMAETTDGTTVTITADFITLANAAGDSMTYATVSETVGLGVSEQAGGLDTGTVPGVDNTHYYLWAIGKTDASDIACLLSLSSTAPTLPSGYTYKLLLTTIRTATAPAMTKFLQNGSDVLCETINVSSAITPQTLALDLGAKGAGPLARHAKLRVFVDFADGNVNNAACQFSYSSINGIQVQMAADGGTVASGEDSWYVEAPMTTAQALAVVTTGTDSRFKFDLVGWRNRGP